MVTARSHAEVGSLLREWRERRLVCLIAFDFPSGAGRGPGVYMALIASVAIASGAGDFRVREFFPRM